MFMILEGFKTLGHQKPGRKKNRRQARVGGVGRAVGFQKKKAYTATIEKAVVRRAAPELGRN